MNRFYLIDKPLDVSSFDVIRILRKKLNTRKMGHTGTLDPLATGGLLIAVGNYTKLIPYFEKDTKEYEFTINLDGETDSYDLGEEVKFLDKDLQEKYKKEITVSSIQKILEEKFTGRITQVPPKYSALKINGKRACDLMREGEEVEIKSREVEISNIEILDYKYPKLSLKAKVSAGTYIRTIAYDLGELLGTGGYVTKLRRTKIGELDISLSQDLDNFEESKSLDIKELFKNKEFIKLDDNILEKINHGLKIEGNFLEKEGIDYFVENNGEVTNIVKQEERILRPIKKI